MDNLGENNALYKALGRDRKFVIVGAGGICQAVVDSMGRMEIGDKVGAIVTSQKVWVPGKNELSNNGTGNLKGLVNANGISYDGDLLRELNWLSFDPVVIDVSNNSDVTIHSTLLKAEFQVITANKYQAALSEAQDAIEMMNNPNYGYDATVMAGQGVIQRLKEEKNTQVGGIVSLQGIFSGTLAYVTKELEKGVPLSVAVENAMKLGYTEPNPMDDLDGMDVAKKLVILARTLGYEVSINDVEIEGLLDNSFREIFTNGEVNEETKENFIRTIRSQKDGEFIGLINSADGQALRYVATMTFEGGIPKLKVGLEFVSPSSELGVASSNKLIIGIDRSTKEQDSKEQDSVVIGGRGAGPLVTASGVLRDVNRVLNRTN